MKVKEYDYELSKLAEIVNSVYDAKRIKLAKERQCALWENRKPDKWPIIISNPLDPKLKKSIPSINLQEAFYNKNNMVIAQTKDVLGLFTSNSDGVPSVRANLGVAILLSLLGLEQEVYTDKMPWLHEHLTKAQIQKLRPEDIKIQGSFAKGLEDMICYKELFGEAMGIVQMDTQGPFDLAHLLYGDSIFMEMYDDPEFVEHLLEICLTIGVKAITWMKEAIGEEFNHHYHLQGIYAENIGIRICEDTSVLISPEQIAQFAMPYAKRLADKFGKAWVHYCGRNDHLTDAICKIDSFRGINFGLIPNYEHDHVFEEDMARCVATNSCYYGNFPVRDGESAPEYLKRLFEWAKQGCILPVVFHSRLVGENKFKSTQDLLDFWYNLE